MYLFNMSFYVTLNWLFCNWVYNHTRKLSHNIHVIGIQFYIVLTRKRWSSYDILDLQTKTPYNTDSDRSCCKRFSNQHYYLTIAVELRNALALF